VFGAIEVSTRRWVYRLGRRCAADFTTLLTRCSGRSALPGDRGDPRQRPLVGAVLVEIHDEWQVGERRYVSEGSMALLIKSPASSEELATPALLKA
jgi:hypothetical protein